MPAQKPPKVVLFDIGGVCVLSPFQGIIEFERKNGIPTDWVNYAIRYSSPNGHWQRLERGEIKMDAEFFKGFTADLRNKNAWKEFHTSFRNEKKRLKDTVNPTQLGDHVSLKAESADSEPTENDRGAEPSSNERRPSTRKDSENERPSLSKLARDTTIGDPVSMESEDVVESSGKSKMDEDPSLNGEAVAPPSSSNVDPSLPRIPSIDGESLFWSMMSASRHPDPYIFPALERLLSQKNRPIIGALSNTVNFPPGHPWNGKELSSSPNSKVEDAFLFDPEKFFDVYIASAEVGMRKPSRAIYELAIQRLDEFDKRKEGNGIIPEDVVFLDDIGENLKSGRELGMKTIRVQLGKTWRAVKELESILGGVELMDEKTRRAKL